MYFKFQCLYKNLFKSIEIFNYTTVNFPSDASGNDDNFLELGLGLDLYDLNDLNAKKKDQGTTTFKNTNFIL